MLQDAAGYCRILLSALGVPSGLVGKYLTNERFVDVPNCLKIFCVSSEIANKFGLEYFVDNSVLKKTVR